MLKTPNGFIHIDSKGDNVYLCSRNLIKKKRSYEKIIIEFSSCCILYGFM
jgi:hypothetical protein